MDPIDADPRVAACRSIAEGATGYTSSHDLEHARRVVGLARHIARAEGADEALVACAAWLHDIERAREDAGGPDHAEAGAATARRLLAGRAGFSGGHVEAIADAVRCHRFRAGPAPSTPEARALHDGDKLDALGAVGLGRAYMMAGEHGQRLHTRPPEGAAPRHVGEIDHTEYSPVEEWTVKLRHLPGRMTTGEGRRLALNRAVFMEAFFKQLEDEVRGDG